ncbi:MAG: PAS domain S-box protein, partial [Candidatus Hermodarchaeota archaeon]
MIDDKKKEFGHLDFKQSETILKTLIESLPFDVFLISKDGYYVMQNSTCKQHWGEVIGKRPEDVANNDETLAIWKANNSRAFSGETLNGEVSFEWNKMTLHFYNIISPVYIGKQIQYIMVINIDITEISEAKQKIQDSEKKHREMIDNLDVGFFRVSLDGTTLTHNQKYNEIFGIDPLKSLVGEMTFDFWQNQKDRENFLATLKKKGKVKNYITQAKKINGETIVLQGNSHLISDEKGEPYGTEGTIIDITEKHNLQKKLEESEKRYRDIAELLPDIIFEIDLKLKLTYVNSIAFDKFGYSKEDFKSGLSVLQFIDPTYLDFTLKNVKLLLEGKELTPMEYLLVRKDGTKFYGLIHSRPIYKNKSIIGIRGTITDINNLVLAEQELKESEEKFRRIFESIPDLYFLLSEDSTILDFTGNQEDLYISPNKFIGKRMIDVLPQNVGSLINEYIKKTLETKKPHHLEYALPIQKELRYFEARFLYFSKNNIAMFIRNISERKKTEAKLKESEEKFRTMADQSLMGICILQDFKVKYLNQQMADIYGYSISEIYSWKPSEFIKVIHPEYKDMVIDQVRKKQEGSSDLNTSYIAKIITKNGTVKCVENYSKPITYQGRTADLLTQIDITGKIIAEQKVRESEDKYRHLYENSPYAILLVNMEGKVIDCNKSAEELSGFKRSELIGKSFA